MSTRLVGHKDEADTLDFSINWENFFADGDTLDTSTWIVPDGITMESDSHSNTLSTIWLSGGTDGSSYVVTNEVTTSGGRTVQASIHIYVNDR
jgi:hypothetical protein